MLRIFISHATEDSAVAQRLAGDLKNKGHEISIDSEALKMGSDVLAFMNSAIADADIVLVLFSGFTKNAKWQAEEYSAALWHEIAQGGGRVIPLCLDSTELPPFLGKRVYGSLADDNYDGTVSRLCADILPSETATSLVSKALAKNSPNPFWRVRAEYFDEELPRLLAEAFSVPGTAKIAILEEMMPCFLEGPRGTGKTMLLLSLRARILASRASASKSLSELFGFYIRLDRGAFCNTGIRSTADELARSNPKLLSQLMETFSQEFYLTIIESLLSELSFCINKSILRLSGSEQREFARELFARIYGPNSSPPSTLEALLDHCAEVHRQLSEFVRRRFIYEEQLGPPIATLDIETFRRILALVRKAIPSLSNSQFTILLDEYENLLTYQQVVVNSVVKLGPPAFSVKIARKVGTSQTSQTTIGQDLQEIHDYNQIALVYSVESEADCGRYIDLLDSIVSNLFLSQGLRPLPLAEILPLDETPEVDSGKLHREVLSLLKMTEAEFEALTHSEQAEKLTYYREAAIYRLVYGKRGVRGEKRFSGVKQLAFMSSGVIRWFQEILGMAYHLEYGLNRGEDRIVISPRNQTKAVHIVSNHNLSALERNIEEYGERLKYFLLDLGDCLRHKLLHHTSEPEAGRIAMINPEVLDTDRFRELSDILRIGVREGVFQAVDGRPGMRPKHGEPQPVEFNISRIYAPALQFSPRLRWKTAVTCSDLRGLIDPETRKVTKGKLMKKLVSARRSGTQAELSYEGGEG